MGRRALVTGCDVAGCGLEDEQSDGGHRAVVQDT
jgi:hypothetical protein